MTFRKAVLPFLVAFGGLAAFLALAEKEFGLPPRWIGWIFILLSIGIYLLVGITTGRSAGDEHYTARRSVPPLVNGMATASQWISAASFLSLAGVLSATGFSGLAYLMGWTGGYLVFAVFLGPYLRQFGRYSIPNFLEARYGGNTARMVGVMAAILVSFTYLVAQMTGVGIIASRFLGLEFRTALYVGLVAVLFCCAVGGMRSSWAYVAQYLIVLFAYLLPLVVLSVMSFGNPVPQLTYARLMQSNSARAVHLAADPQERATRSAWAAEASALQARIADPATPRSDKGRLAIARATASAQARPPATEGARTEDALRPPKGTGMWNFLALLFCLVVGTAALPHILTHYYTTASVRRARTSIAWTLSFIVLLYLAAPAYAAFARHALLTNVVGSSARRAAPFITSWAPVGLFTVVDKIGDGVIQLADLVVRSTDFMALATPEMAGLPFVITGVVLAGGLMAALPTAESLLLTIANAVSHDLYYKAINPKASLVRRLMTARLVLLATGLLAAHVATYRLGVIAEVVACAFSLAGAAFFPALVMGIWWKRANKVGAVAAIVAGTGVTLFYMVASHFYGVSWFGTATVASGIFGIPVGFVTIWVVSLATHAPPTAIQDFVVSIRYPRSSALPPLSAPPSAKAAIR